jgi:hypothetical protein
MSKTTRTKRSFERPGRPKENPNGLPYGSGSIQMRSRTWWMIYRDPEGRIIQENTRTDDQNAARRILAERAIVTLEARLKMLRKVANGREKDQKAAAATLGEAEQRTRKAAAPKGADRRDPRPGARSRHVPANPTRPGANGRRRGAREKGARS